MITAGLLALALLGPVSFAVLSMRSTSESRGASAGAWIVVGILLVLVVAAAAAAGGALVAGARRVLRHLRGRAA
jgi:threonine/homoserine/homoserine lactone efflux protein